MDEAENRHLSQGNTKEIGPVVSRGTGAGRHRRRLPKRKNSPVAWGYVRRGEQWDGGGVVNAPSLTLPPVSKIQPYAFVDKRPSVISSIKNLTELIFFTKRNIKNKRWSAGTDIREIQDELLKTSLEQVQGYLEQQGCRSRFILDNSSNEQIILIREGEDCYYPLFLSILDLVRKKTPRIALLTEQAFRCLANIFLTWKEIRDNEENYIHDEYFQTEDDEEAQSEYKERLECLSKSGPPASFFTTEKSPDETTLKQHISEFKPNNKDEAFIHQWLDLVSEFQLFPSVDDFGELEYQDFFFEEGMELNSMYPVFYSPEDYLTGIYGERLECEWQAYGFSSGQAPFIKVFGTNVIERLKLFVKIVKHIEWLNNVFGYFAEQEEDHDYKQFY